MPNTPTLLRQFPEAPPTPVQAITARLREECAREQITTPALAVLAGMPYKRVWSILSDRSHLHVSEFVALTRALGLDIGDVLSDHAAAPSPGGR